MIKNRNPRNIPTKSKIIISCEDSCNGASYKYFDLLKQVFLLKNDVEIISSKHKSDPLNVVKKVFARGSNYQTGDKVFIVVDKDGHKHSEAINFLNKKTKGTGKYIISNICFEYWLLLHEKCTNRSFENSDGICKELGNVLNKSNKKHHKTDMDYRHFINSEKIKQATEYSKKIYQDEFNFLINNNPSTNMYVLIDELKKLNSSIY